MVFDLTTLRIYCSVCGLWGVMALAGCNTSAGFVNNETGRRMYAGGRYDQARAEFQRALADDPDNAHYAFNLASAMQKQCDLEGAQRLYRHAINVEPRHQPSYHALAKLMVEEGNVDAAQSLVGSWVATQPYSPEAHMEMAWIHEKVGNFGQAEEELQQALEINPRSSLAAAHLGHVYEQTGQLDQAVAMYDRSLMLNPARPSVHNRYAEIRKKNWSNMMASSRTEIPVAAPTTMATQPMMMPTMTAQAPVTMPLSAASPSANGMLMSATTPPAPAPSSPAHLLASFTGFAPTQAQGTQLSAPVAPGRLSPAMIASARPMPGQPVVPTQYIHSHLAPTAAPSVMPPQVFSARGGQSLHPVANSNSGIIQASFETSPSPQASVPVVQPF